MIKPCSAWAAVARLGTVAAFAFAYTAQAQTYRDGAGTIIPGVAPLVGCSPQGNCAGPVSATNPLPVTGSFSLGSLNGMATAANQTNVQGAAGSPAAIALSVQGVSGGFAMPVSGTFWQATQPVSLATLPALASGSNTIGAVAAAGTTGADYSANKPAMPNVGSGFSASGPYANYVLIATIAASPTRNNIDIENTSGAQIAIVRDDGTASLGAAPNSASVFALSGGALAGAQGGSWSSRTFRGRVQIYAPSSSAQVSAFVD